MVTENGKLVIVPHFTVAMNLTAMVDDGWQLEAQALPKRGRCLQEDIVAIQNTLDHLSLKRSVNASEQVFQLL
jgi:hypothetical protein